MSQQISCSVVIPTCGRHEALDSCLSALLQGTQQLEPGSFEIIITDDNFSAEQAEAVSKKFPGVTYLRGPGCGPAANRNNGARHAHGDYLIFTDDDCLPTAGWITGFLEAHKNFPKVKVLEGRVFADRPQKSFDETSPLNETGGYLWSCNLAINRAYFHKIGMFQEKFPFASMEDVELRKRIRDTGEEILFCPQAAVCHPWRKKKGWREFKQRQFSTLLYLSLHPSAKKELTPGYFVYAVTYGMAKFVVPRVLRGQTKGLSMQILEYLSYLQTAFLLLTAKFRVSA